MKRQRQKLFRVVLAGVLMIFSFMVYAQERIVTGKVYDSSGESIIGASVMVQGTMQGVVTDIVCDDSYLVGVVSRKDLLRASMGQTDSHTMPISMIMTPVSKVITVEPTDTLVEAAQKMIDYEVDCLPVVVREDVENKKRLKVVGRVSKTTVAKVFLECSIH